MRILNSLIVSKKVERGTLLLWNGFLFHVRSFGCVQNEVLSTYDKVLSAQKVDRSRWTDEKTSQCESRAFSLETPTNNNLSVRRSLRRRYHVFAVGAFEQVATHGFHTGLILVVEEKVLVEDKKLLLPTETLTWLFPQRRTECRVVFGLVGQVDILVLVEPQTSLHLARSAQQHFTLLSVQIKAK